MYSPKISEAIIPILYHAAKQRRVPMTHFVDALLSRALHEEDLTDLPPRVVDRLPSLAHQS